MLKYFFLPFFDEILVIQLLNDQGVIYIMQDFLFLRN